VVFVQTCRNLSFLRSILVNSTLFYRPLNLLLYLSYPSSIVQHQILVDLTAPWRLTQFNTVIVIGIFVFLFVYLCQGNWSSTSFSVLPISFCSFIFYVLIFLILRCSLVLRFSLKVTVLYYLIVEAHLLASQGNDLPELFQDRTHDLSSPPWRALFLSKL